MSGGGAMGPTPSPAGAADARKRREAYAEALRRAADFLREEDDFLVVSHLSPDGDAIGSTAAVGLLLKSLGKTYALMNADRPPEKYAPLLAGQELTVCGEQPPARRFRAAVAVDCADFERIGAARRCLAEDARILNIDHHPTNEGYGTVQLLKFDAAATVQIVFDLAETLGVPWTKPLAECIYGGLLTDTGGFRYANTTPEVMAIAERMLRYGADGNALAEQLLEKMSFSQVMLLKEALATLSFTEDRKIAWMSVTRDLLASVGAAEEDTDGLVNIPRNIEGVEVGLLFKEKEPGEVKVSLRSAGRVDVAALAKSLGGGGHVRAAGCTVRGTVAEAERLVVDAVKAKL